MVMTGRRIGYNKQRKQHEKEQAHTLENPLEYIKGYNERPFNNEVAQIKGQNNRVID